VATFSVDDNLQHLAEELREAVAKRDFSPRQRLELYRRQTQAGIIPIYLVTHNWAARLQNADTRQFLTEFGLHAKGQIECALLLEHDFIYNAADIFDFEPEALGADLNFSDTGTMPSLIHLPLADDRNFHRLKIPNPETDARMPALLAMKHYLQQNLGDIYEFEATGSSPFSLACNLRGYENFAMDMMMEPDYACELLDFCVEVCRVYLNAQLELGLKGVHIADAWAAFPLVTPEMFDQFIFPAVKRLFKSLPAKQRLWTGLYGLSNIKGWRAHLGKVISCGTTEICVYQKDLQNIDLGQLKSFVREAGVQVKLGIYGTNLTPYEPDNVSFLLRKLFKQLDTFRGVAVHVSNVPWHTEINNIRDFVGEIRALAVDSQN
jgi:uroporphyrinogen decarboxylase